MDSSTITTKNGKLAVQYFKSHSNNSRPTIVTLHAFTGKKENKTIYEVATIANSHGFDSLCFDFSGHGESSGDIVKCDVTQQLAETKQVIDSILVDKDIILVGNSFSVVTASAFASKNQQVRALVLISGRADQKVNAEYLSNNKEVMPGKFITEEFIEDYLRYSTINILKEITIPTIIIHGEKDNIIPAEDAKILFDCIKNEDKKLVIIKDGDHRFNDDCRKKSVDIIYEFLEKHF